MSNEIPLPSQICECRQASANEYCVGVWSNRPNVADVLQQVGLSMLTSTCGRQFIEPQRLDAILTREKVELAIVELDCEDFERANLAADVHQSYRKVFAILVLMHREDDIISFRQHRFTDNRLPLDEKSVEQAMPDYAEQFAVQHQWAFIPHFFEDEPLCYQEISSLRKILPFLDETPVHEARGKFSEISIVRIPASLQSLLPPKEGTVLLVRKRIKLRQSAFKKEMRVLSLLRPLAHPNVVRLLASYTYDGEHNFLFPRLKMDLGQFLALEERFGEFRWDSTFHLALYGLASALESIHQFLLDDPNSGIDLIMAEGYHHDFRPANILVTDKTFVLADFGLGDLKSTDEVYRRWFPAPGDYFAPECHDEAFEPQPVSQKIDTWAFGCLIADVLTYMENGPQGVRAFHRSRRAFSPYKTNWESTCFFLSKEQLKPSVIKWLANVKTRLNQGAVDVALQALDPSPEKRISIKDCRANLAIPTLQAVVQQVLGALEEYLDAYKNLQRLTMKLWWAHMHISLFGYALSAHGDRENHFLRNSEAFGKSSTILMATLRLVNSKINPEGGSGCSDRLAEDLEPLSRELTSQLSNDLRNRAEAEWFLSFSKGETQLDLLRRYYALSHMQKNRLNQTIREDMRKLLAQMKSECSMSAPELYHDQRELKAARSNGLGGHEYGFFRGKRVLVESMHLKSDEMTVPPKERLRVMQLKAKSFGTDLKPDGLRILKCLGFIDEVDRQDGSDGYSFIYELPPQIESKPFTGMITLHTILDQTFKMTVMMPDPQEKAQLAHSLALFIKEFHSLGCLHENLNSRNIVFAIDPTSRPGSSDKALDDVISPWSQPYVIGLQKSRPAGQEWSTEGPAVGSVWQRYEEHPDYMKTRRFLMEYDYYSLGVVLLQIAAWTPLGMLTEKQNSIIWELREQPQHRYYEKLRVHVGRKFTNVVRVCLDGTLDRHDKSSSEAQNQVVFRNFIDKVIKPLEQLSVLGC